MKKILLATTALVLSAGIVQAQAVINGQGRMGLQYNSHGWGGIWSGDWRQEHRLRLNINVAVDGDHGLRFGAFTRAQMASGNNQINSDGVFSGANVFVESNGLRLTFGNQDGAIASIGYTGNRGIGYTGGTFGGNFGYLIGSGIHELESTAGERNGLASLRYTMGDLSVMVSSNDHFTNTAPNQRHTEVAVRYRYDAMTFALGATSGIPTTGAAGNIRTVSANYNGGGWQAGLMYTRVARNNAATGVSLTGSFDLAGGTLNGYVARRSATGLSATDMGVGYAYGLGGGASISAGVERNGAGGPAMGTIPALATARTRAEVGIVFNF